MKIRQAAFPVALLGLLLFVACCNDSNRSAISPVAKADNLETGEDPLSRVGIGVAVADMNGDGYTDIVSAISDGVKYFENDGNGSFFDRGVIAETTDARLHGDAIGIAVADLDGNGVSDIVIAGSNGIRIFKNPILQKK